MFCVDGLWSRMSELLPILLVCKYIHISVLAWLILNPYDMDSIQLLTSNGIHLFQVSPPPPPPQKKSPIYQV